MKRAAGKSRRRLLYRTLLALSGGASAGWLSSMAMRRAREGARRVVCRAEELAVGEFKLFECPGPGPSEPCILIRSGPDDFVAYVRTCTHESCAVSYRAGAARLECACHGGAYAVADGRVLQGPPPRALARLRLLREDDYIVVARAAR